MNKEQKQVKPISNNKFFLALGLFLILFASVLVVDVGYTARTINFVLYFCFGFGIYLVLFALLIKGFLYLFANKKMTLKHKGWLIPGIISFLLGLVTLITVLTTQGVTFTISDFAGKYWTLFEDYYQGIHYPFLYLKGKISVGGGFIGYFLTAIAYTILPTFQPFAYIFAGLFMLIGIIVTSTPYIIMGIENHNTKAKAKQAKRIEEKQKVIEDYAKQVAEESLYEVKDKTRSVIKMASKVKNDEDDIIEQSTIKPINSSSTNNGHIEFANTGSSKVSGLVKAHFVPDDVTFKSHNVINDESNSLNETKTINVVPEKPTQPRLETEFRPLPNGPISNETPKEPLKKPEQIHFDFEETKTSEPEENLVALTPTFSEPKPLDKNDDSPISMNQDTTIDYKPNKVKHNFIEPSLDLLNEYENSEADDINTKTAEQRKVMVNEILGTFGYNISCCSYVIGPAVTRYNIEYKDNASFRQISGIVNDISIRIGGIASRFDPIVPGQSYSGLEIPNAVVTTVGFKDVMLGLPDKKKHPLAIGFGKNIAGEVIWADLNKMPHMLVSGTTGSGKSIFMHSIIMSLIMRNSPDDLRLLLIDPKMVELAKYKDMPHLLRPNITDHHDAVAVMQKMVKEMEKRYAILQQYCVSGIDDYNELCEDDPNMERMPYYVCVLDEYNDLVQNVKEIAAPVILLSGKARACGIHLVIITQRPSTDVVTGVIKSNLPTHVALMTASSTDSITIIGEGGAEKLLGKGDMLVQCSEVSKVGPVRVQSSFMKNKEILKVVDFLKKTMTTDYIEEFMDLEDHSAEGDVVDMPYEQGCRGSSKKDERYEEVKQIIMGEESCSISKIQRDFGFGFSRAGKIFNQLVAEGILEKPNGVKGSSNGSKVLIHNARYGITGDIGSDEVAETESMSDYLKNSDKNGGAY